MTNYALIDQAVVSLANFVVSVLVARNMGIEYYGYYAIIMMIAMFTQTLFLALFTQPMMSGTSMFSNQSSYYATVYVSLIITLTIAGTAIYLVISFLSNKVFDVDLSSYSIAISLFIFTMVLQDFTRRILFAQQKGKDAIVTDIINYFGKVLILYTLMFYHNGSLLNVLLISSVVSLLSVIYSNTKLRLLKTCDYEKIVPIFKSHLASAKWLMGSAMMQWFTGNSYVLAAGVIIGPEIVGVVRIAQNLMGMTHVFLIAMENFAPKNAARIYRAFGVQQLRKYIIRIMSINYLFVTVSLLALLVFSDKIVGTLYGVEYTKYSTFIVFYIFVYYVLVSNAVQKIMLRTMSNTKWIFYGDLVASIFSSTTAYFIITSFHANGIIYGTITSALLIFSMLICGNVHSYQKELKKNEIVNHHTIV